MAGLLKTSIIRPFCFMATFLVIGLPHVIIGPLIMGPIAGPINEVSLYCIGDIILYSLQLSCSVCDIIRW